MLVLELLLFISSSAINYASRPQIGVWSNAFWGATENKSMPGRAQGAYGALVSLLKCCGKLQRRTNAEFNTKNN